MPGLSIDLSNILVAFGFGAWVNHTTILHIIYGFRRMIVIFHFTFKTKQNYTVLKLPNFLE